MVYNLMHVSIVYLKIFSVAFILRDEEFAKIRSWIKLNATFNNTSHILITQKINHENISDTKISKWINIQIYDMILNGC